MRGEAQRQVQRALRPPVRRVRGEHDPLGRHAREQLDDVEREEAGDVVEHARVIGQHRGQDALVADRAVREDQHDLGVAQRQLGEPLSRSAAGRGRRGSGSARRACSATVKMLSSSLPSKPNCLRAGVQLDPARPRRDAALGLRDRLFGGVQAAERDQPALAFAGPREHAVVGDAVGRAALGVVQREDARAPRAGVVELGQQLPPGSASARPRRDRGGCARRAPRASAGSSRACFGEERRERIGVQGVSMAGTLIRSRGL